MNAKKPKQTNKQTNKTKNKTKTHAVDRRQYSHCFRGLLSEFSRFGYNIYVTSVRANE